MINEVKDGAKPLAAGMDYLINLTFSLYISPPYQPSIKSCIKTIAPSLTRNKPAIPQ